MNQNDIDVALLAPSDELPQYSEDDFINTRKPFEWLYTKKDELSPFEFERVFLKIKKCAQVNNVKAFDKLWRLFINEIEGVRYASTAEKHDNITEFEGSPLVLQCGDYTCTEYGITSPCYPSGEVIICKHPIMPVERMVNIDTGEQRLKIAFKRNCIWSEIIVEKSMISSCNKILELSALGVFVNNENAKELSTYLLDIENWNYNDIPEKRSVSRLGWVGNNKFSPYVDSMVFDGNAEYKQTFNAVKESGNFEKWLEITRKVRSESLAGKLLLAASFASVILEPCGLLPFFLHAWGGTETGKTVGLMLAASVWANPECGDYIISFNATNVALELKAAVLNSLPMCVDELQIQAVSGAKDFDKLIYMLSEGAGRARGAKSGGLQKTARWKNCIITNGERPITSHSSAGGAVNRIIEFECDKKVYSDLPELCSVIRENYGFAGKTFIEYLQRPGSKERVRNLQREYYRQLIKGESTDKQAAAASALLTADEIAEELIFKDGNSLKLGEMQQVLTSRDSVDANKRAQTFLYELVEMNPNKFKVKNDWGEYQGEVWGKTEPGYIYFIKQAFDREMRNAGFDSSAFLSWAKREGIIETEPNRRTKKCRITHSSLNCVCLLTAEELEKRKNEEIGSISEYASIN